LGDERILLSDVTFAIFHYPVVLVCPEYHAEAYQRTAPPGHRQIYLHV